MQKTIADFSMRGCCNANFPTIIYARILSTVACGIAFPEEKEISKRIAQWVRNVSQRGNGGEKRMRGAATASDN